jgi:hypothetical protein
MQSFRDLQVWQRAIQLTVAVYRKVSNSIRFLTSIQLTTEN